MYDITPWQDSDIGLKSVMRQVPTKRFRYNNCISFSSDKALSQQKDELRPTQGRHQRVKTTFVQPLERWEKRLDGSKNPLQSIKQTLDLVFQRNHQSLKMMQYEQLQALGYLKYRQRNNIKKQKASVFSKDFSTPKNTSQLLQPIRREMFIPGDYEIFRSIQSLSKRRRQQSLILPKIKLAARREKPFRQKKFFFEPASHKVIRQQ